MTNPATDAPLDTFSERMLAEIRAILEAAPAPAACLAVAALRKWMAVETQAAGLASDAITGQGGGGGGAVSHGHVFDHQPGQTPATE